MDKPWDAINDLVKPLGIKVEEVETETVIKLYFGGKEPNKELKDKIIAEYKTGEVELTRERGLNCIILHVQESMEEVLKREEVRL